MLRYRQRIRCRQLTGSVFSYFGVAEPLLEILQRDDLPVALLLFFSGFFTPGIELLVGDAARLDPGKALLVLLAVGFEHRIVGLLFCPLLEGPGLPAGLLSGSHRALTVLRADPAGLGEPPSAVLAPPDGDPALHTAAQGVVDHVRNVEGIQNRRAPSRLHRFKAEGDGPEGKQRRILGGIIEIVCRRLLLWITPRLIHIQNEIKETLYLLLIKRELFRDIRYPLGRMMEDQGTTYRIFQQCGKVAYRPVPLYYYYQRPDSILHRRNMKFYEDKLDMGYQKYRAIREAYPGMSENDAAMLSVVEHCYPYLMQDTERCAKMEAFLQECDPAAAKLLCTSSQRKYQLLRCSRRLYAKLFLLKNGPAAK